MGGLELRADCARCEGLCCVGLAFDQGAAFAFDKPADTPCRYLSDDSCCGVHAALVERGFSGCARYDCFGAGQRVCTELFPGRSWRESPELARRMFEAFRVLQQAHELSLLLCTASRLELSPSQSARREELELELERAGARASDVERLVAEVRAFFQELRALLPDRALARRRLVLAP